MSADHYQTLGVQPDATQEEISRAFKKLARECHPDLNQSPDAAQRFQAISEAHDVLRDPQSRRRYDAQRRGRGSSPFGAPRGSSSRPHDIHFDFGAAPFSDLFSTFSGAGGAAFNLDDLFSGFDGGGSGGGDVHAELTVTLAESLAGVTRSIELASAGEPRRYDVKIPKGVRDGQTLRLAGQGRDLDGGRRGDLYLRVKLAPDPAYAIEGDDMVVEAPVNAWDAALGAKVKIATPEGPVTLTIPPGVSSEQRLRLAGKGLWRRSGAGRGDLYAEVKIVLPERLTPEQKRLFQQLRGVSASR